LVLPPSSKENPVPPPQAGGWGEKKGKIKYGILLMLSFLLLRDSFQVKQPHLVFGRVKLLSYVPQKLRPFVPAHRRGGAE